jgi:tetratricopeptide (TPR) repeat protein
VTEQPGAPRRPRRPARVRCACAALLWLLAPAAGVARQTPGEPIPPAALEVQELTPGRPQDPPAPTGPDPLRALEAVAEASYVRGNLDEAVSTYRQVAERLPPGERRTQILVLIGWIDHLLGRPAEARAALEQALYERPDLVLQAQNYTQPFVDLFQESLAAARSRRLAEANEKVRAALEQLAGNRPEEARRLLGEALALQPNDPNALYNLALVDLRAGAIEAATAGFERLLSLAAGQLAVPPELQAQAHNNLGVLYFGRGLIEDAARQLERAVLLAPADARAWSNLGLALRRLGRREGATDAFRRAVELDPADAASLTQLASVYAEAGRHADARALLSASTARLPDQAALWLQLGLAERELGNPTAAVAALERAIALDANNQLGEAARAAVHLARLHLEAGDPGACVTAARQVLGWKPNDVEGLTYLGLGQQALGDLAAAREALERAAALAPDRPELLNNLGTVYFELDDLGRAEEAFRKALALRPDFPAAATNLDNVGQRRRDQTAAASGAEPSQPARRQRSLSAKFTATNIPAVGLRGLLVDAVSTNGAAAAAGLRKGDLVLLANGQEVATPEQLEAVLAAAGDTLVLDLLRESRPMRVSIRLR